MFHNCEGQSHKIVSTDHSLFEEKGEPKRYRTEVLPLTSLTPYRWAKLAHVTVVKMEGIYCEEGARGYFENGLVTMVIWGLSLIII